MKSIICCLFQVIILHLFFMNYLRLYMKYMMQNVHVKCEKKVNRSTQTVMDTETMKRKKEQHT